MALFPRFAVWVQLIYLSGVSILCLCSHLSCVDSVDFERMPVTCVHAVKTPLILFGCVVVLGSDFQKYMDAFKPFLVIGLKNYQEYQVHAVP